MLLPQRLQIAPQLLLGRFRLLAQGLGLFPARSQLRRRRTQPPGPGLQFLLELLDPVRQRRLARLRPLLELVVLPDTVRQPFLYLGELVLQAGIRRFPTRHFRLQILDTNR